jgi:hypothetical protein
MRRQTTGELTCCAYDAKKIKRRYGFIVTRITQSTVVVVQRKLDGTDMPQTWGNKGTAFEAEGIAARLHPGTQELRAADRS